MFKCRSKKMQMLMDIVGWFAIFSGVAIVILMNTTNNEWVIIPKITACICALSFLFLMYINSRKKLNKG